MGDIIFSEMLLYLQVRLTFSVCEKSARATQLRRLGLELANGGKYYIRIQIVNLLGLATVACSDGVTIDNYTTCTKWLYSRKRRYGLCTLSEKNLREVSTISGH